MPSRRDDFVWQVLLPFANAYSIAPLCEDSIFGWLVLEKRMLKLWRGLQLLFFHTTSAAQVPQ